MNRVTKGSYRAMSHTATAAITGYTWVNVGARWFISRTDAEIGDLVALMYEVEEMQMAKAGVQIDQGNDVWLNTGDSLLYAADGGSYIKIGFCTETALAGDADVKFHFELGA